MQHVQPVKVIIGNDVFRAEKCFLAVVILKSICFINNLSHYGFVLSSQK